MYKQILSLFEDDQEDTFDQVALDVFRYQADHNSLYRAYLNLLGVSISDVTKLDEIPLLPISFFKYHGIQTGTWVSKREFRSSGTTQTGLRSRHLIKDPNWYKEISTRLWLDAGYDLDFSKILALLPSYLDNGDSSLVQMTSYLCEATGTTDPFYLHDHEALAIRLREMLAEGTESVVLIGVTYALLDFGAAFPLSSDRLHILFTGGMKGRREELLPSETYSRLQEYFPLSPIRSEYGMTEMLSQAYSGDDQRFRMSTTLRVQTRNIYDPLIKAPLGKTGIMGIIDLANVDTLSFIMTDDLGIVYPDDSFVIMGRMQSSDLRGCNLLYDSLDD